MRLVVLTDSHANLPALKAFKAEVERDGYDLIYHTGDAVHIGPYPLESLDLLFSLPRIRFIMGNHDAIYVQGVPDQRPTWMAEEEEQHYRWSANQLGDLPRETMRDWPYIVHEIIEQTVLTFAHYGLNDSRNDFASVIQNPSGDDLDRLFQQVDSDLVFYGHDHYPSDISGESRYVNPGAFGCNDEPVARYCVVEIDASGYRIEQKTVPYDPTELFAAFEKRQVPARDFILWTFFGRQV